MGICNVNAKPQTDTTSKGKGQGSRASEGLALGRYDLVRNRIRRATGNGGGAFNACVGEGKGGHLIPILASWDWSKLPPRASAASDPQEEPNPPHPAVAKTHPRPHTAPPHPASTTTTISTWLS